MASYADCNGCTTGDHAKHRRVVQAVPEGMLGGVVCPCEGDCAERNKDWAERLVRETFGNRGIPRLSERQMEQLVTGLSVGFVLGAIFTALLMHFSRSR